MPLAPVQQKINIQDIQDGVVILKNGDLRAVLMTSSVNFALKSTEEQDALIYKYQGFLNSLDFPIQILMTSRHLNIGDYLSLIEQKGREQTNELLRIQITEYADFIKNLVEVSDIMSESFYVIVPLARVEKKDGGLVEKLGLLNKPSVQQEEKTLDEFKAQLWQRVEYITSGLASLSVKAVPLNTEELVQVFYGLYNMSAVEKISPLPKEKNI